MPGGTALLLLITPETVRCVFEAPVYFTVPVRSMSQA
jgi:hypothetical protein